MQHKANCSTSITEQDTKAEQAVMRLLLEDRGLFTFGEIVKGTGGTVLLTRDALDRLQRGGMVHEFAGFVLASRTAVVSADLWNDA